MTTSPPADGARLCHPCLGHCDHSADDGRVVAMVLNLSAAKTRPSALVEQAAAGVEIVTAKNGRPRAKVVAIRDPERRRPGRANSKIRLAADFDAPLSLHEDPARHSGRALVAAG